jgi:hypothetical protein
MSSYASPEARGSTSSSASYEGWEEERGVGWVVFAGVLLLMVGSMNFIEGIAAIGNAHFFVNNTNYVFGDLNTWGWVVLCLGVLQILVSAGVFFRNQFARWTGVAVLSVNAIVQLLMIPAYPFWSLTFFAIDLIAIYGLTLYGDRIAD